MEIHDEDIELQFEGDSIICKKKLLIENSLYFDGMFKGNFREHQQKVVRIQVEVSKEMMELLLRVLNDNTLELDENETMLVLEASCILLFTEIQEIYKRKILQFLKPRSSIEIWIFAEKFALNTLALKAKALALLNFQSIKTYNVLNSLNSIQLYTYLGNRALKCDNEMDVFDVVVKWWKDNSEKLLQSNVNKSVEHFKFDILIVLLSCINFKYIPTKSITIIKNCELFRDNNDIQKILCCVINKKEGKENSCIDDSDLLEYVNILLNCKKRHFKSCPCILVNPAEKEPTKFIHRDNYKRLRYSVDISKNTSGLVGVFYDNKRSRLSKCFNMDFIKDSKYLNGFNVLCSEENIYLFGGETNINGKSAWNVNIWMYDTICENWIIKTRLPFLRRYFQSCICGDFIYLIGGTGTFRVIKHDMIIYNFKEDKWSVVDLPFTRQFRSCVFKNQLFIFDINERCAYMFKDLRWIKLPISPTPNFESKYFVAFSYKEHLYLKSDSLIKLELKNKKLITVDSYPLQNCICTQAEAVVCDNFLYTVYKLGSIEETASNCMETICMEKFDIESQTSNLIIKDATQESPVPNIDENLSYRLSTVIFSCQHYSLFEDDEFINNYLPY